MLGIDQFIATWHVDPFMVIGLLSFGVLGTMLGMLGLANRYKPESLLGSITGKLEDQVIFFGIFLGVVFLIMPFGGISNGSEAYSAYKTELNKIRATQPQAQPQAQTQPQAQPQIQPQPQAQTQIQTQPQAQPQPGKQSDPIDEQTKLILSGIWLCFAFFLQRLFEKMFADKGYALLAVCAAGFLLAFFTANYFLLGGSVTGGIMGSVGNQA